MLTQKAQRQSKKAMRTLEDITQRIADDEASDVCKRLLNGILNDAEKFLSIEVIPE